MVGHMFRHFKQVPIIFSLLLSSGFVWASTIDNNDPFEKFNRGVFIFNEQADRYLLKPIAKTYKFVTPDPIERGVERAFDNLEELIHVANDLLQGKLAQGANDGGRFLINSTLGFLGFFDVANQMGLKKSDGEDFGQTLGFWGVKQGPYLVLPLLGPSSLRDAPSRIVDGFVNPIANVDHIPTRNSIFGGEIISSRAALIDVEELISGDRYLFTRDIYLQRRKYLVNDGQLEDAFGDDYDDFSNDFDGFE